jgi:formate-dependent nitrite reductase cytochrome c552 subunit
MLAPNRLAQCSAAALAALWLAVACHQPERAHHENLAEETVPPPVSEVEPRIPLLATYPCSAKCHNQREPNPKKRLLVQFHTIRNKEFHHGDPAGWCYQCHSQQNIDRLLTAKGELVTFNEAYKLCGGCHGDKLRDWRLQVHGKTFGHWKGERIRRSCTACHNPHNPHFQKLQPEPPPLPPEQTVQPS